MALPQEVLCVLLKLGPSDIHDRHSQLEASELLFFTDIITLVISRITRWAGHVERMEEVEYLEVDGSIVLKSSLKKYLVRVGT